jgi:hypothetical protein
VRAHLPANILAKLRDLHAYGIPISFDSAFFHFGGGMFVRNLCRERLSDKELATYCSLGGSQSPNVESLPRFPVLDQLLRYKRLYPQQWAFRIDFVPPRLRLGI